MGTPPGLVGEGSALMGEQRGDDRLGHGVLDHVGHRRGVDHVLGVAGAQQLEDAQPALGRPGGEPGEAVVADVRGGLVVPGMARPGVVDRHPAGGRQPGLEDGVRLGVEAVLVRGQEGDDLALGDADAQRSQLDEQALGGDLPLDVLHQDVAHDPGAEVAGHLRRQRGDDLPPVRRQPPLPPVADDPRREHQVLDRGGLVALAPRARGHRGGEDALLRDRGRAPAAALVRRRRRGSARPAGSLARSMPPGASLGRFGRSLSRAFSSRRRRFSSSSAATRPSSWTTSRFSSSVDRASRAGRGGGDMSPADHAGAPSESPRSTAPHLPPGLFDRVRQWPAPSCGRSDGIG